MANNPEGWTPVGISDTLYWEGWEVTSKHKFLSGRRNVWNCSGTSYRCRICKKHPPLKPGNEIEGLHGDDSLWFDIEQGEACPNETCRIIVALIGRGGEL